MQSSATEETWKKFKKMKPGTHEYDAERDRLVKIYTPIVKYHTDRIAARLPREVRENSKEDLYVEGIIGLIEAIDKFDPAKNVKFETFATKRVRGAVIDTLRREDILPKNVREQAKKIEKAYLELEAGLGRPATDDEIAKELKMTKDQFYDILDRIKGISLVSLDTEILNNKGETFSFEDVIGEEGTTLHDFEKQEAVSLLASFIETLDREERIVLETYYWDGLTFKEIGKVLDLSESRVCQIHTKIILKLRSGFRKSEQER